jgi:hypothetical protein
VEVWFWVGRRAHLDPEFLPVGYAYPHTMTVHGEGTSFEHGTTTVTLFQESFDGHTDDYVLVEVPDAGGDVVVVDVGLLTFDLLISLEAGYYLASVTTGDETVDAWLYVGKRAHLDPQLLVAGFDIPQSVTVYGEGTSFAEDATQLTVMGEYWDDFGYDLAPVPGAVENLVVVDPGLLTFHLVIDLAVGHYFVVIETGDEVLWIWFEVIESLDEPGDEPPSGTHEAVRGVIWYWHDGGFGAGQRARAGGTIEGSPSDFGWAISRAARGDGQETVP